MAAISQRLVSSAVSQYARYRTGYPPQKVAEPELAARLGLDHTQTVVDVGCGSRQFSLPLARYAGWVVAIDPVPDMLALGRQTAQAANTGNITWLLGDANNLESLVAPRAHAVTFAASFPWTDRPAVVRALDRLLEPEGLIVTIHDDLSDTEDADWVRAITDLRVEYLGEHHSQSTDPYRNPPYSDRTVFCNSAFSSIQELTWEWDRELSAEEAVGLQFTYSFSTPALLGDKAAAFARDARAVILAIHPDGRVTEQFRMQVLIASPARAIAPVNPCSDYVDELILQAGTMVDTRTRCPSVAVPVPFRYEIPRGIALSLAFKL